MNISKRDSKVTWHPYSQAALDGPNLAILKGSGSKLYAENGDSYIDAISSWWVNIHGHAHPYITKKIVEQLDKLHHVIFAGFTHEPAVLLAEILLEILPGNLSRVFYSDDGSTAVEVALKMTLQYWQNKREKRTTFVALEGAYHGDTFGAMSVSARDGFASNFADKLFEVAYIPCPDGNNLNQILASIRNIDKNDIAGFIYEPLLQGASGMRMYSQEALIAILKAFKDTGALILADEVFTGFGRTGSLFASERITIPPDIICLSKGLTGGTMPLGATATREEIYEAFLSESREKMFLHGHSYTANPLACVSGLASLDLLLKKECLDSIRRIEEKHKEFLSVIKSHQNVRDVRVLGTVFALDIKTQTNDGYFNSIRNKIYAYFLERGILLRPLGNVLYLVPPYCITNSELDYIYQNISNFLDELNGYSN
jgi:adenosylmethionine---8-amino-7-oxononanoate aminotransferase